MSVEELERVSSEKGLGLTVSLVKRLAKNGFRVRILQEDKYGRLRIIDDSSEIRRIIDYGPAAPLYMLLREIRCLVIGEQVYRWVAYGE